MCAAHICTSRLLWSLCISLQTGFPLSSCPARGFIRICPCHRFLAVYIVGNNHFYYYEPGDRFFRFAACWGNLTLSFQSKQPLLLLLFFFFLLTSVNQHNTTQRWTERHIHFSSCFFAFPLFVFLCTFALLPCFSCWEAGAPPCGCVCALNDRSSREALRSRAFFALNSLYIFFVTVRQYNTTQHNTTQRLPLLALLCCCLDRAI